MNRQRVVVVTTTYNEMGMIIDTKAEELDLSAQPTHDNTSNALKSLDCIDRQAAVDAVRTFYADNYALEDSIEELLEKLPSVQPEIVKCRECKHMQKDEIFHQCWCNGNMVKLDDYCSYAERRQNE